MEKEELENAIKTIADKADLIINGYAFLKNNNEVKVVNLNRIEKMAMVDMDGKVLNTTMDEIEVDVVLDYYNRNRKYIDL